MFVKELWRYPVKSIAGERLGQSEISLVGIPGDRNILIISTDGKLITSRTHHRLLGLRGTLGDDAVPRISGRPWDSSEALELVKHAVGGDVHLIRYHGIERFDVLPLLIATDGAIDAMGFDGRRLRPNIVIGGVEGLEERKWQGRRLQIGEAVIQAQRLRRRCVMTTYDPDTLRQDYSVLKRIIAELDGRMALNCAVVNEGIVRERDPVVVLEA